MSIGSTPAFRGRTPRSLAFGTSGLRGLVEDITDLEAWVNVRGFLEYLLRAGLAERGAPVALAGDLRPSTDRILRAVRRAIMDAGFHVVDCGRIPTPALAFFAFQRRLPSVMVTGSHIPFDRNGIKFNRPDAEVLKSDEAPILEAVGEARGAAYTESPETSAFDDRGMLLASALPPDPAVDDAARAGYMRRYLEFFPPRVLEGLRVAVYQHSAVGRDLLVDLLSALGAAVEPIGRSEVFVPVDTEAVDDAMLADLGQLAEGARARLGGLDALVSTDGDSDRPLLVAFDAAEEAVFVRGDTLGAMVAEELDADAVAVPVSASDLVDRHLGHRGVHVVRTRIGSPYVIEAMAAMLGACKVGFEANGGFLVETRIERDGRALEPLPTRDAFLPLLSTLARAAQRGERITERLARLPHRHTTAGLVDAVPREVALQALAPISTSSFAEAWTTGGSLRYREHDAHPRTADAGMQEALKAIADRIDRRFGPYGLGRLEHVSWVDGVRLSFGGGDVVHLRASGNAPQFRVYVTADTLDRAKALVATCLSPTGPVTLMLEEARRPGDRIA